MVGLVGAFYQSTILVGMVGPSDYSTSHLTVTK